MSNLFLPSRFDEKVRRSALGIEPQDAARGQRVAQPIEVVFDGVPSRDREPPGDLSGLERATVGLRTLSRHASGRYVATSHEEVKSPATVRIADWRRRFVPRRLRYPLPSLATTDSPRLRRPALFPAAAYPISETATGLRGRVMWHASSEETPARWVRVEARSGITVVGRAHGDDRGEFLLLLDDTAAGLGDLAVPFVLEVRVFGPAGPPVPSDPTLPDRDPLWDLPVEAVPTLVAADTVSEGTTLPPGYTSTASSVRQVTFVLGRLISGEPEFVLQP